MDELVWAPAEPERKKKRRIGLWLGIPGGVIVAAAVVSSVLLIAPGVSAAGADVSWRTSGSAAQSIAEAIAATEITLDGEAGGVTLTGADLGLSVDAEALAQQAHSGHPLWKVGSWNAGSLPLEVAVDEATALAAVKSVAPDLFSEPVDASVEFDASEKAYTVVDAEPGTGIDVAALTASISTALSKGAAAVTVTPVRSEVEAPVTTAEATEQVDALNTLLLEAGFYVGEERAVGFDRKEIASWLTVEADGDRFHVDVDEAAIERVVGSLAEKIDRDAVDERVVTDSDGKRLRVLQEGQDGWKLGSTDGVAASFAEQLSALNGVYALDVEVQEAKSVELFRRIDVDKSEGVTRLYENDKLVASYSMAIGKPSTPTDNGEFRVYAQLTTQDMGCVPGYDYCTKGVPWITYFNGDQGLHGTYWHSNFGAGAMMSHGCVNLTIAAAEAVYRFAQVGTEVSVHD